MVQVGTCDLRLCRGSILSSTAADSAEPLGKARTQKQLGVGVQMQLAQRLLEIRASTCWGGTPGDMEEGVSWNW